MLPSALNLPQANPATTLEYAPVPPEDDVPPDAPPGNLSSLGLPTGSGLAEPPPPPPEPAGGIGKSPRTKRCVGEPLRQTEDPQSPPCVAYFDGDNFGRTYRGVTRDEIRIVLYHECCNGPWTGTSRGAENDPGPATLVDTDSPGRPDDSVWVKIARVYSRFFNERYQTYNRHVHVFVYFGVGSSPTPETRRADAADLLARVDPFAVISYAKEGSENAFLEAIASRGILTFSAYRGRPAKFFAKYPKLVWGYFPSIEVQADQFVSFICQKVVGYPTSFSGDPGGNGQPRRIGILSANNPDFPEFKAFADRVRPGLRKCGANIVADLTFHSVSQVIHLGDIAGPQTAQANIAEFKSKGVTTIVWPTGYEIEHGKAAANANYRPEWIVAGDGTHDGYVFGAYQEPSVWAHAWAVTNVPLAPTLEQQYCYQAAQEADPRMPPGDLSYACGQGNFYNDFRQLFTGIQAAGPKLTPGTIDEGFRAVPPYRSSDPTRPACYYEPGDYTCVKDAAAMYYDPSAGNDSGGQGAWRMADGGQRYPAGQWPKGDVMTMRRDNDPVSTFKGTGFVCC